MATVSALHLQAASTKATTPPTCVKVTDKYTGLMVLSIRECGMSIKLTAKGTGLMAWRLLEVSLEMENWLRFRIKKIVAMLAEWLKEEESASSTVMWDPKSNLELS